MTAPTVSDPHSTARAAWAPRRALSLELTLQRPLLWANAVVAALILVFALTQTARLGIVVILLAVAVPGALTSREPVREADLRGSLGISRADHVRSRVMLALAIQAGLLVVAALVILFGPRGDGDPSMFWWSRTTVQIPVPTFEYWQDLMAVAGAVVWSHVWIGRDGLRSSSTYLWARALISYLGMYVLNLIAMFLAGFGALVLCLTLDPQCSASTLLEVITVLGGAAVVAGGLLVLRWRSRVWAREA